MGAKGRGVLRDFRMARVSCRLVVGAGDMHTDRCSQFQFRLNALAGNIPGVKKASW
jgi:small subunit ribosomal protein S14